MSSKAYKEFQSIAPRRQFVDPRHPKKNDFVNATSSGVPGFQLFVDREVEDAVEALKVGLKFDQRESCQRISRMAVQSKLYKEAIREFHGIYYLLKLCKEGDQKTKEEAVTALRNCCAFSSANRTHFREKGGIQILGTLLRSHHPGIVLNAAATLANISYNNDDNKNSMRSSGVLDELFRVIATYEDMRGAHAAAAIANSVVSCPMNREYVLQIKGIAPLMHLARIGMADSRAHAVRAIANLCAEDAKCRKRAVKSGIMDILSHLLNEEGEYVQAQVASAIANMSQSSVSCRYQICACGCMATLIDLLSSWKTKGNWELRENCCRALWNLVVDAPANRRFLVQNGGIKALIGALRTDNIKLRTAAAATIRHLCFDYKEAQNLIAQEGALEDLLNIYLNGRDNQLRRHALAALMDVTFQNPKVALHLRKIHGKFEWLEGVPILTTQAQFEQESSKIGEEASMYVSMYGGESTVDSSLGPMEEDVNITKPSLWRPEMGDSMFEAGSVSSEESDIDYLQRGMSLDTGSSMFRSFTDGTHLDGGSRSLSLSHTPMRSQSGFSHPDSPSNLPMSRTSKLASVFMEARMTAQDQSSREIQVTKSPSNVAKIHDKGFWRRHLKPPQDSGLQKVLRHSRNSYEYAKDFPSRASSSGASSPMKRGAHTERLPRTHSHGATNITLGVSSGEEEGLVKCHSERTHHRTPTT